ncbi:hypothetical protein GCM10010425_74620 [Streptomyces spororaveus]|uniref:Uncharacterized protein n=1 Tax=Streptomyces spororaveus TaxID=284039 RepID=A0ABQ3T2S2_9ACTN|nr:hypothetical protein Sspor_02450 [Streptomyces spororaveus]
MPGKQVQHSEAALAEAQQVHQRPESRRGCGRTCCRPLLDGQGEYDPVHPLLGENHGDGPWPFWV